jgi:enoyl-CoA hydratase/carnithine racemase
VTLNRPPVNAINYDTVRELRDCFRQIRQDHKDVRALVLSSDKKDVFSAGLDLPSLIELSRAEMIDFFRMFVESLIELSSIPLVASTAINGHSPAGGYVYAAMTDYRVMEDNAKYFVGLNETSVGIVLPASVHLHYQVILFQIVCIIFDC